jgi:hypothetical protein
MIESRRMDISFDCPRCNQHLAVDTAGAGLTVNCPSCNEQIEIPRAAGPPAPKVSIVTPPPHPPAVSLNPKPERVTYDASTNTFRGTILQVLKLAMRAVQELGWTLVNVNDTLGLVTFETGMTWASWSGVSGSLSVVEVSENQFRVSGTAKQNVRGGQLAALDLFGEAQGKVSNVLELVAKVTEGGRGIYF